MPSFEIEVKLLVQKDTELSLGKEIDPQLLNKVLMQGGNWAGIPKLEFPRLEFQIDTYFAHPRINYIKEGKVLRRRSVRSWEKNGEEWTQGAPLNLLTYKGPKGAGKFKNREEREFPADDALWLVLGSLGFEEKVEVKKCRWIHREAGSCVCVDAVEGLGWYCEVEKVVHEETGRKGAEALIEARLKELGLHGFPQEKRSYAKMTFKKLEKSQS